MVHEVRALTRNCDSGARLSCDAASILDTSTVVCLNANLRMSSQGEVVGSPKGLM